MTAPFGNVLRHPACTWAAGRSLPPAAIATGGCQEGLPNLFSLRPNAPATHRDREAFAAQGPRIETDRLVLRVLRRDDFEEYAAMLADPETFRFAGRGAMGSDEAWTRLLRHVGHWTLMGWGLFAIEEKATGRFVGEAGLGDFCRGLGEHHDGAPEGAWTIAGWAQGRGYATEAMRAAIGWLEQRLGTPRTVCLIHIGNLASLRVADKLGYRSFSECGYRGYNALLFERLNSDE